MQSIRSQTLVNRDEFTFGEVQPNGGQSHLDHCKASHYLIHCARQDAVAIFFWGAEFFCSNHCTLCTAKKSLYRKEITVPQEPGEFFGGVPPMRRTALTREVAPSFVRFFLLPSQKGPKSRYWGDRYNSREGCRLSMKVAVCLK